MTAQNDATRMQAQAAFPVDTIQQRIAHYSDALTFDALPAQTVHCAKALVIDTLGVLVAGFNFEPCVKLRTFAAASASADGATVLGTRLRTTPDLAAFVNASTARYVEANDVFARYKPGTAHGHPSDVIAPLLAVAEHAHASGREFLNSVVLAYEIYLRICDACHSEGFDPATFGCIAIAAATGRLFRLPAHQIAQAVSMAATAHNILKQVRSDHVTVWKALAAGQAGRDGVQAGLLAKAGIEGPSLPFQGVAGWCDHVAGKRFELPEMGGGTVPFLICESRIKTRPARALTISSILAAEKLAGRVGDLDKVSRIVVMTYKRAKEGSRPQHWVSRNRETADHSIPYCVAAALIDGVVTPQSFDDQHLNDLRLRKLMAVVEIVEDEAYTVAYKALPQSHRGRVSVHTQGGGCFVAESGGDEDDLASPKSDAWVERKFRAMTEAAVGAPRGGRLLSMLWALDNCQDVASLVEALVLDQAT